nr:putative diacylglycerol O-acyltransferase [Cryobacterium sp. SO1]
MDLAEALAVARAERATVNDLLLVAIAGALRRLLEVRGERLDEVVVSVPFSARQQTTAGQLGNQSGVIPLRIPAAGDARSRLGQVAALTRTAKQSARGASTALIGPLFRLLARVGLYQRFIERQRLIHTFTSNLRGPAVPLTIFGAPITAILPLSPCTGNVTIAFAALSYAGTLAITVVADPDACPDLDVVPSALAAEFMAFGRGVLRAGAG